jgi:predicted site-specific integrase-resolvase
MSSSKTKPRDGLSSIPDAARKLDTSERTIYTYAALGKIKTIKLFNRRYVLDDEISRILSQGTGR